ncbi:MAG: LolA family protein [Planctomycetota bacterium]|jgi:hypothetical protein
MRAIILLFLFCCCGQDEKPRAPVDDLKDAIAKVRGKPSYEVRYKATIKAPNSDPMVIQGTSLWVRPGVLYVHYKASGGDEKRIIRVGERVWLYHELVEGWVTAEQCGNRGAGRGVQNPDEVLGVLQQHVKDVKEAGEGKMEDREVRSFVVKMSGPEIEGIMKEQASQGTFVWKESKASAKIHVDKKDGLVYKFTSDADLKSADPNVEGVVKYFAEVEVLGYEGKTSYEFTMRDPDSGEEKPLEVPEQIRRAIKEMRKSGSGGGEEKK